MSDDATTKQPHGRIAAVDYGTVRIGVAVSNASQTLASPYDNYTRRTRPLDAEYFRKLAKEESIARFVVGLPVHTSGRASEKSVEAKAFGAWLGELTGLPIDFFDERYTTSIAQQMLADQQVPPKRRKERLDKLAAQILLTAYLESTERGNAVPQALDDEPKS
ncbi:MAG: Holliday junction resolvase RuvX [Planctomycetia bacterium]|nr:Holliday junction resolvase RuvX [Planctomycetia bacterium]